MRNPVILQDICEFANVILDMGVMQHNWMDVCIASPIKELPPKLTTVTPTYTYEVSVLKSLRKSWGPHR